MIRRRIAPQGAQVTSSSGSSDRTGLGVGGAPEYFSVVHIAGHLQQAWQDLDVTVEEGLRELSGLCITQLKVRKDSMESESRNPPNWILAS